MLINLGFFAKESHPKRNNEIFTAFYDLRSEEHTSELQSLTNRVCRLLLD